MQLENDCNDFTKIIESSTFRSSVGGQVYAVNRRGFRLTWTTKDFWKTPRDPGLVVFEGDACCLFRHHPIEGPWTGAKTVFGQYVSAAGSIEWHPQCPWPRNSKTLYVSYAWLKPGPGRPKMKLWGRRLLSDQWTLTCLLPLFPLYEYGYVESVVAGAFGFGGVMAAASHAVVRLLFWMNRRRHD